MVDVRIATTGGDVIVGCLYRRGVYAVHKAHVCGGVAPGKYTITHTPSGYAVGHAMAKREAEGIARALHKHAPDATLNDLAKDHRAHRIARGES